MDSKNKLYNSIDNSPSNIDISSSQDKSISSINPLNELNSLIDTMTTLTKQNFKENASKIKDKIYKCLYGYLDKKKIYIDTLSEEISQFKNNIISLSDNEFIEEYLSLTERLQFLFIFHYDFEVINLGLSLQKFLYDNCGTDYQKESLDNITKIIQLLSIKKDLGSNIYLIRNLISNCSLSLILGLKIANKNVKKDFINKTLKSYISDINVIYLMFIAVNDKYNLDGVFEAEDIAELLDSIQEDFDKYFKQLNDIINKKNDKFNNISSQKVLYLEKIGQIYKILTVFANPGFKPKCLERIYRNTIQKTKLLFDILIKEFTSDNVNIHNETIYNILYYFDYQELYDSKSSLNYIAWCTRFIQRDKVFLISLELLCNIFIKLVLQQINSFDKKKLTQIDNIILKILENIISYYNKDELTSMSYIILYKIYSLIYTITPDFKYEESMFPKTYDLFINNNIPKEINYKENNSDLMNGVYYKSINYEKYNDIKLSEDKWKECLKKFEDFSYSLKNIFDLNDNKMNYEQSIFNYKNNNSNALNKNEFKKFYLDCTINMYTEIFKED